MPSYIEHPVPSYLGSARDFRALLETSGIAVRYDERAIFLPTSSIHSTRFPASSCVSCLSFLLSFLFRSFHLVSRAPFFSSTSSRAGTSSGHLLLPLPPPPRLFSPPLPSCGMSIPSARCHFHCGRARSERRVRTSGWFTAPFRSFYYPILVYHRCVCVNPRRSAISASKTSFAFRYARLFFRSLGRRK